MKSIFPLLVFVVFSITCLNAQCDEWNQINPAADWSARAGLQAVSVNDVFYIMGGRTPKPPSIPPIPGDSEIWNDVWTSQDNGQSWTEILTNDTMGNHWPARAYFQALSRNDSIFILGGQNYKVVVNPADNSLVSSSDFFNDVWVSGDGLSWQQLTDSAGWTGRAGLSSVVYNGEIYVMGGSENDDAAIIGGPPQRIYYNDVWKSADGANWQLVTDSAAWSKRAGGIAVVKDDYIYMIGGEEGFLCLPGSPCPPYFNDVWRTQDGSNWELVTANAPWSPRPGHQCVVADDQLVLFGGFGLDTMNIINPANPIDIWVSNDGSNWEMLIAPPWNATLPTEIKYDFDALVSYDAMSDQTYIYSFGGDRETFNFFDPLNYLNIDNDVWRFCVGQTVSVENSLVSEARLDIAPNPAKDYVRITSEAGIQSYTLYDLKGNMISSQHFSSPIETYILKDVADIPTGIYLLQLQTNDQLITHKLIRQ